MLYLVVTKFKRWKKFLLMQYFRMELNLGQEKPLPKIIEDKRGEEDFVSDSDPRDKFPIKEEEKTKIDETRDQLN